MKILLVIFTSIGLLSACHQNQATDASSSAAPSDDGNASGKGIKQIAVANGEGSVAVNSQGDVTLSEVAGNTPPRSQTAVASGKGSVAVNASGDVILPARK